MFIVSFKDFNPTAVGPIGIPRILCQPQRVVFDDPPVCDYDENSSWNDFEVSDGSQDISKSGSGTDGGESDNLRDAILDMV